MLSLERPAKRATCVVEALENRQLSSIDMTIPIDFQKTFNVPVAVGQFDTSIFPLRDSRLLVGLRAEVGDSITYSIFPFNDSSDAKKRLYTRTSNSSYPLMQLSDGNILMQDFSGNLTKFKLSGELDSKFGLHGKIQSPSEYIQSEWQEYLEINGHLIRYTPKRYTSKNTENTENYYEISSYDLNGKLLSSHTTKTGGLAAYSAVFTNGDVVVSDTKLLYRFRSNGLMERNFGSNGILEILPDFDRWAKHIAWKSDYQTDAGTPTSYPLRYVPEIYYIDPVRQVGTDSSFEIDVHVRRAYTRTVPSIEQIDSEANGSWHETVLTMRYSADGKLMSIQPWKVPISASGYASSPYNNYLGGDVIHYNSGQDVNFLLNDGKSPENMTPDGKGGFYFVKSVQKRSDSSSNITIAHSRKLLGSISGRTFSDKNSDGVRQPGEMLLVNQKVFIDRNGNRKCDFDELTTTTDSGGYYVFNGLYEDIYSVRVIHLANSHITTKTFSTGSITLKLGQSKWGEIGVSV